MEYVFIRADCFYIIDLKDDDDARANAEFNAGTIRVEGLLGDLIWEAPKDTVQ